VRIEALEVAEYALSNKTSNQAFALNACQDARSLPSDSTALDTMLKAAELKGRREALLEAADYCDDFQIGSECNLDIGSGLRNMAKELE
jgi:hypothetical protein